MFVALGADKRFLVLILLNLDGKVRKQHSIAVGSGKDKGYGIQFLSACTHGLSR